MEGKMFEFFRKKDPETLAGQDFVPDPEMEDLISKIDNAIASSIVCMHESVPYGKKWPPEIKNKLDEYRSEIERYIEEGGDKLKDYLLPWKNSGDKAPFSDRKRVRAANQLWSKE